MARVLYTLLGPGCFNIHQVDLFGAENALTTLDEILAKTYYSDHMYFLLNHVVSLESEPETPPVCKYSIPI